MATPNVTPAPVTTDPEVKWLCEQSGLTDTELAQYQAILGDAKFKTMLMKVKAANENALTAQSTAEAERLALEKRLNDDVYPEVRKVAQESVRAQGELARAKAELEAARAYGIVPASVEVASNGEVTNRAPGSPSPAAVDPATYASRDDLGKYRADTARTVLLMQDIAAEHQMLTGKPLMGAQELYTELEREQSLGHKDATLRSVWEKKHDIGKLRTDRAQADKQKELDAYAEQKLKSYKEQHGDRPESRVARESRYSKYDTSERPGNTPRWQRPVSRREANSSWRQAAVKTADKVAVGS